MSTKYQNDLTWPTLYGRVYCVNLIHNISKKDAVFEFVGIVERISGRKVICTNMGAFSLGAILYYNFTFPDLKKKEILDAFYRFMDNEYYKNFETLIIFYSDDMRLPYEMKKLIDILAHYYDLRQFDYTAGITDVEYLTNESENFAEFRDFLNNYKENVQMVLSMNEEVDYFGNIFIMKKIFLGGFEYDHEKYIIELQFCEDIPCFKIQSLKRISQRRDKEDKEKTMKEDTKEECEERHCNLRDNYVPMDKKEQMQIWKRQEEKEIESEDRLDVLPKRKSRSERRQYSRDFYRKDRFYRKDDILNEIERDKK